VQSQTGSDLFYGSDQPGVVSVNGGRGRSNNFSVNGGDANDQFVNAPVVQPSPDSIEEFRVITNTFDAEYGRNSGAVVNVITKSGTNAFHGNVYEFFRNKVLNSKGYFDTQKPQFQQNQFGGTFGGPIKKDKTFFFVSYEGRRIRQGISSDSVSVPTAAERSGDFSAGTFGGSIGDQNVADILNARGGGACGTAIAVANGSPAAAGDSYASIFPNSQIPTVCMDPTALALMNRYVPLANTPSGTFQTAAVIHKDRTDQFTGKFDHRLNDKQNLSVYYYFTDSTLFDPYARFQAGGADVPGFGADTADRYQQWNVSHNWTLTNSAVNEFHFTYFREAQGTFLHPQVTFAVQASCGAAVSPNQCFNDGTPGNPTGIHPGLGANREGVPFVSISGGVTFGNNFEGEIPQRGNTFEWSDNFSLVKGSHTMKFGADIRRMEFNQTLFYNVNGDFSYYGGGTNSTGYSNDLYPDYLLGLPDSYSQGSAQKEEVRSTIFGLFAQDSWKIKKNLTLNYGLRWELFTPLTDISQHVQTFRPGQLTSVYPCQLNGSLDSSLVAQYGSTDCSPTGPAAAVNPVGLVFPRDKGVPAGLTSTYYKTFAPRIGLAWSPGNSGKTSIRVGWGMFYNPIEQLVLEQFSAEPPFGGSNIIASPLFNTPFQNQAGDAPKPNPFNGILNPTPGQNIDWALFRPILLFGQFQPHLRTQYSDQYNLNIQHELAKDLVLQVGYVGSQAHRLLASHDLNYGNAQTCIDLHNISQATGDSSIDCGQFFADSSFAIAANQIPAGMTLHLPYGAVKTVTGPNPQAIGLVGLRRYSSPLCQPVGGYNAATQTFTNGCPIDGTSVFSSIFAEDTIANSNYNSAQVSLEKRFSRGLQLNLAYTFSKSFDQASSFEGELNPLDYRSTYSLSQFDARHRLVVSYVYELPIPKYDGLAGKVLDGWDISGIYSYQTGFPIRITSSADNELMYSAFFEYPGEPAQLKAFKSNNPHTTGCAYETGPSDPSGSGQLCQSVLNQYFDPNTFTEDTAVVPSLFGQIGSAKRTYCCGPPINNFDFALHKVLPAGESKRFEFRAEFFNMFNHTQFDNPDGNSTDGSDFGRIKRAKAPREVQMALKYYF
jgi:hypothetical protein